MKYYTQPKRSEIWPVKSDQAKNETWYSIQLIKSDIQTMKSDIQPRNFYIRNEIQYTALKSSVLANLI